MDIAGLASSGATAIISAVATDAWLRMRSEFARILARREARRPEVVDRLENFATELSVSPERDVHNRLQGYLEAKLSDDPAVYEEFLAFVRTVSVELRIEPPTQTVQGIVTNGIIVQTAGGPANVQVNQPAAQVIRWLAMTGPEAARKLESMELIDAVEALADMEPSLAARRLSHVDMARAQQLLSHMDEGAAAEILRKTMKDGRAAELLAGMDPPQAAAILDMTLADWAVARLAEMDPSRALSLLAVVGSKRTEDLLSAMERQQAVILLGAVGKVLTAQNRVRTTLDLAEQEAERIAADARQTAQETLDRANAEAETLRTDALTEVSALRATVEHEIAEVRGGVRDPQSTEPPAGGARHVLVGGRNPAGRRSHGDHAVSEPLRLADEFFLISHDARGRPRINQISLETIICGAVLCDLISDGLVDIAGPGVAVAGDAATAHPAERLALGGLTDRPTSAIPQWIKDSRKEMFLLIAQTLAETETVIPAVRRWTPRGAGIKYQPTAESSTHRAAVQLVRSLLGAPPSDPKIYILAALIASAQLQSVLPIDLKPRQVRDLVAELLKGWAPSPAIQLVLRQIEAVDASAIMAPRPR